MLPPMLERLKRFGLQALRMDPVRMRVAYARFVYFTRLRRRLSTLEESGEGIAVNAIRHNLKGLSDLTVNRSHMLVRPLSVIEALGPESRILAIGPRTEGELLNLFAHGFSPDRVRGLDLISYSPLIELGNMHHLQYPDGSWDAVLLGWVLTYSTEQQRAAKEVLRVLRPGGIVAIGVEHNPRSDQELAEQYGVNANVRRFKSTQEILDLFAGHVGQVYFRHDVIPERRDQVGSICVIFSVTKSAAQSPA
jgi:SAM-dependent methyltransferase